MWLTPPENLIMVVQRVVKREFDRKPRSDKWEVTVHSRIDFIVENYNMCVIAYDISTSLSASDYSL
jgi:hypothetical protein